MKAYRRPVSSEEVNAKLRLVALAQKEGDSFEEGIRLALEAVLASPDFLFRTQLAGDHELASRLSYFLWRACRMINYSALPMTRLCATRMCLKHRCGG